MPCYDAIVDVLNSYLLNDKRMRILIMIILTFINATFSRRTFTLFTVLYYTKTGLSRTIYTSTFVNSWFFCSWFANEDLCLCLLQHGYNSDGPQAMVHKYMARYPCMCMFVLYFLPIMAGYKDW